MQRDGLAFQICPQVANHSHKPPRLSGWPPSSGQHHYPNTKESFLQPNHKLLGSQHKKGKNIQFNRMKLLFINHFWSTLSIYVLNRGLNRIQFFPFNSPSLLGYTAGTGSLEERRDSLPSLPSFLLEPSEQRVYDSG